MSKLKFAARAKVTITSGPFKGTTFEQNFTGKATADPDKMCNELSDAVVQIARNVANGTEPLIRTGDAELRFGLVVLERNVTFEVVDAIEKQVERLFKNNHRLD